MVKQKICKRRVDVEEEYKTGQIAILIGRKVKD